MTLADISASEPQIRHGFAVQRSQRDTVQIRKWWLCARLVGRIDSVRGMQIDWPAAECHHVLWHLVDTGQNIGLGHDVIAFEAATLALTGDIADPIQRPGSGLLAHTRFGAVVFDVIPHAQHSRLQLVANLLVILDGIEASAPLQPPISTLEFLVIAERQRFLIREMMRPIRRRERCICTGIARGEHDGGSQHDIVRILRCPELVELGFRLPSISERSIRLQRHKAITRSIDHHFRMVEEYGLASLLYRFQRCDAIGIAIVGIGFRDHLDDTCIEVKGEVLFFPRHRFERDVPHWVVATIDLTQAVVVGADREECFLDEASLPSITVIAMLRCSHRVHAHLTAAIATEHRSLLNQHCFRAESCGCNSGKCAGETAADYHQLDILLQSGLHP